VGLRTARPRRQDGWRCAALFSRRRLFVLVPQADPARRPGLLA